MNSDLREQIKAAIDDALQSLPTLRDEFSSVVCEDYQQSPQDRCEIIAETVLREFGIDKSLAEDIAVNIVRRLLPYLQATLPF
jgi:hypothetical protein